MVGGFGPLGAGFGLRDGGFPGWVLRGGGTPASIDMDFKDGLYWGVAPVGLVDTRTSTGTATDLVPASASGASFNTFANGVVRITAGVGLLSEGARTNLLLNSTAPVARAAGIPFTPFIAAAKAALGPAYGEAVHDVGTLIAPETAAKDRREDLYQMGESAIETASNAMAPRRFAPTGPRAPVPLPTPPQANGPLGVTLSEGQASRLPGATQNLPAIQVEQAAVRGQLGPAAQSQAAQFNLQQAQEVSAATERMTRGFDPYGMRVAETPQEAGQLVQQSLQNVAAQRKADVQQAYKLAEGMPGEIHPDAFRDMPAEIKSDLSNRPDPIIIDDHLTPWASRALSDIEGQVSQLQIQNRASPYGQPSPNSIAGVNLKGVDQIRRRLSTFRQNAFASGNASDGRAAQAVLDAFDNQIDTAVNGGLFRGDPRAVTAWNDTRAANADYRATFSGRRGDPVGVLSNASWARATIKPPLETMLRITCTGLAVLIPIR
jgi:hypothetical protein